MAPHGHSRRWGLHGNGCAADGMSPHARVRVLDRDNWTCRACGDRGSDVHHLSDADYRSDNPRGMVTLCRSCHQSEHRLFGQVIYQSIPRPVPRSQLPLPLAA
jgi:hypothetical protein